MPVKMGTKETGEKWRDNYITPAYIQDAVAEFYGCPDYYDPCLIDPVIDAFQSRWGTQNFINPPFSEYKLWAQHGIINFILSGSKVEQIWLCHTNNSSGWFKQLTKHAAAICLLKDQIKFIDPRTMQPTDSTAYGKSQSLIYIGPPYRAEHFAAVFSRIGTVWRVM